MKNNINETELNILNNTQKPHIIGKIFYYIIKGILETIYIITCIICTTIEVIAWILTFGTATRTLKKYKRGKRTKRWY